MNESKRFNEGKNRLDLINPLLSEEVGKILTFGAEKYGAGNYKNPGMPWSKCIASLKRHLNKFEGGEDYDNESNELHISHILTNALFILEYYKIAPQFDDRQQWFKKPLKRIWWDIDGPLCEFEQGYLKWFNLEPIHPTDWSDSRFRNFKEIQDNEDFWMSLEPLIKPEEITYPIAGYCTARGCSNKITQEWLDLHGFPNAPIENVETNSKADFLNSVNCDIFVDDSINNFIDCQTNGKFVTYLMSRPHNLKYDVQSYRVNNIKELLDRIKY